MELYVDIADIDVIEEIAQYFPIDGFTTNPKIFTQAKRPITELMAAYKTYAEKNKVKVFIQVTGATATEMFEQAKKLHDYFGECFVVKIPAVKQGYQAIRLCKEAGIPVAVTVVHSMMQALVAAKAGADYVAPYVSHIDNMGADGVGCVAEMITAFQNGGYPCKVIGASFRTVDQLKNLAVCGCQAVTIAPPLFDALIAHPATAESVKGFEKAWSEAFGDKQVSDLLPE